MSMLSGHGLGLGGLPGSFYLIGSDPCYTTIACVMWDDR